MTIILQCADLPQEVWAERIVAHPALDGAARLALFQSCHALARMVLQRGHGITTLIHRVPFDSSHAAGWPATLACLFDAKWQPLAIPNGLQLHVRGVRCPAGERCPPLPPPPPLAISQLVRHLQLSVCKPTAPALAAWCLYDDALWPQLQHLTVADCCLYEAPRPALVAAAGELLPLPQPVPRLLFFTWTGTSAGADQSRAQDALMALGAHAEIAHVECRYIFAHTLEAVVRRLPRLTHLHLHGRWDRAVVEALLQHPTLRHLELGGHDFVGNDWSRQPCRWQTLTLLDGASLADVSLLPLASLERLTIHGLLRSSLHHFGLDPPARMALLRRLRGEGRLVLAPGSHRERIRWLLPPGAGPFELDSAPEQLLAMLTLVLEAGQSIDTLILSRSGGTPLQLLREVAQLLQQHAGRVTTLCFGTGNSEEWHAGLLGTLPPCIQNVRINADFHGFGILRETTRALVEGGVASVRHALTLSVLCSVHTLSVAVEAELRQLLGQGQHGLSLEVLRT